MPYTIHYLKKILQTNHIMILLFLVKHLTLGKGMNLSFLSLIHSTFDKKSSFNLKEF